MLTAAKRALVLAPHTDDGEFGCGGTMARLVEQGVEVRYVAFSIATKSLPRGLRARHACPRGARGDRAARHPRRKPRSPRLRGADVPRPPPGHPRAADRALGGVEAGHRLPAVAPRRPPGPPGGRRRRAPRLQAHDDPRLRGPVEQLRLHVPGVRGSSSSRTSSGKSRRSPSTPRSSTGVTPIPSTSAASPGYTA